MKTDNGLYQAHSTSTVTNTKSVCTYRPILAAGQRRSGEAKPLTIEEIGKETMDQKRKEKEKNIHSKDTVLSMNMHKENKLATQFEAGKFIVKGRQGPNATIQDPETGAEYSRNVGYGLVSVRQQNFLP